ncbi:rhodanese-like domain-containing protein [Oligoflexia bacterium]|nr:rhodanese-like domain-containing protein [Oligoflexia bacterium]
MTEAFISTSYADSTLRTTDPDLLIIDTRPKDLFDQLHIEGAINLSALEVKSKFSLKNERLLLVGQPFQKAALDKTCGDLKRLGFKRVKAFYGGLPRWKADGGVLKGDISALGQMVFITPKDLIHEIAHYNWIVVDVVGSNDPLILDMPANPIVTVQGVNNPSQLAQSILARISVLGDSAVAILTLKAFETLAIKTVSRLKEKLKTTEIFLVEGGREALNSFLAENQKMLSQLKQNKRTLQCR